MNLQSKILTKNEKGELDFSFDTAFSETPAVILTPCSSKEIGHVTSLKAVSNTGGTLYSDSHNYQIYMIACDQGHDVIGDVNALAGSVPKSEKSVTISLEAGDLSSPAPAILITTCSGGSVKHVDTVDDSAASECSVISDNTKDIAINYLAMDIGSGQDESNNMVQSGIYNKTGSGTARVYFSSAFTNPPCVVISPWWDDANDSVGHIDTVTKVTKDYFEFSSDNSTSKSAYPFCVNWLAVGTP